MSTSDIILNTDKSYNVVKELHNIIGLGRDNNIINGDLNNTNIWEWIQSFERSLSESKRLVRSNIKKESNTSLQKRSNEIERKSSEKKKKKHLKRKSKGKKCVYKLLKDKHRRNRHSMRRYMIPILLGLLIAKSLLILLFLKALAFITTKGLILGFLSTIMASVLSLRGALHHSFGHHKRKDDGKTQIEIIHKPAKIEHLYDYGSEPYRRNDILSTSTKKNK